MKILLVSDLHYALKQFDWIAAEARHFDAVILAGDHIDIAGQLDGGVQVLVILKYLKRLAAETRVLVSSGNHDLDTRDAAGEKTASWMRRVRDLGIPSDGESVMFGDTLITICPWWDGPVSREGVGALLARDAAKPKARWLWIYHAPPANSPTAWNGRRFYGDEDLSAWIALYQPDIVFAGHIHEAPFKAGGSWADQLGRTWVFNCGRQIGPTPTHIAINTEAREAAWFSLAGAELVRLDAPLARPLLVLESPPAWLNTPVRDRSPA
ncbi:MAG: metallophosphoesterase [Hyphomonadaceae bacterium]|nr:metallophosphoesterase [Hyphomonadaceae bacterium]MBX3510227.1 metallophosphoesterase [Hyphomonadaceae bacterium]